MNFFNIPTDQAKQWGPEKHARDQTTDGHASGIEVILVFIDVIEDVAEELCEAEVLFAPLILVDHLEAEVECVVREQCHRVVEQVGHTTKGIDECQTAHEDWEKFGW